MTNVDIVFRYGAQPTEAALFALAGTREVYGIRQLTFDREAKTVRLEYDATRLTAAVVSGLVRRAGLDIVEEVALIPPPAPERAAASPQSSVPAPKA
ncbi:MAG TPA: hypothetical protein VGL22_14195 [Terracidiphilus sp.]|jgi:hypothetical protein